MKTVKLIGFLMLVTSLSTQGQTAENKPQMNVPDGWKSLVENNYAMQYPNDWELSRSGQMGTSFIVFSPLSSDQDQFRENINLIIQDLTGHQLNLDDYVEISENQLKTMITDCKIIKSERMKAEKADYQKVIFTGTQGIFHLKFEQYYWVVKDEAFVLTFTCEEDQFNKYQALGEHMMTSFNF